MFYKSKLTLFLTIITLATQSHGGCEPCDSFFASQPNSVEQKSVADRKQAEYIASKLVQAETAKYKTCSKRNHARGLANHEKLLKSFDACNDRNRKIQSTTDSMYIPGQYAQYSEKCTESFRKVMASFEQLENCGSILDDMMSELEKGSLAKLQAASIRNESTTIKLTAEEVIAIVNGPEALQKFKDALRSASEPKTQVQTPEENQAGETSSPE